MLKSTTVVVALLGILTACSVSGGDGAGPVCTAIGSVPGLGIEVPADVAPIGRLALTVCVEGRCRDEVVSLAAGDEAGEQTCEGTGDDAACSVELTPNGTQYGFIQMVLPEGPVQVSGSYRAGGRTVTLEETTVDAELSYPNGPDCGSDGTQARATIGADGLS